MADRIGVINKGELILVEEKAALMAKLGKRQLTLQLAEPLTAIPAELADWPLELRDDGTDAGLHVRRQGANEHRHRVADCGASAISASASRICTRAQSSLEDIFVSLVHEDRAA